MQQTAGGLPEGRHCSLLLLLFYIRTIEWAHPERLTFTVTRLLQKDLKKQKNKQKALIKTNFGEKKKRLEHRQELGTRKYTKKIQLFKCLIRFFAQRGMVLLEGSVWQVLGGYWTKLLFITLHWTNQSSLHL